MKEVVGTVEDDSGYQVFVAFSNAMRCRSRPPSNIRETTSVRN